MVVLIVVTLAILQLRKGTIAYYLGAMRGADRHGRYWHQSHLATRLDLRPVGGRRRDRRHYLQPVSDKRHANSFNYELSLVFVVVVVITGVSTVEGAIAAGVGLTIIEQLVTYVPGRFGGESLVFMLFAFGALTYASHPEGVLEFEKRTWTARLSVPT